MEEEKRREEELQEDSALRRNSVYGPNALLVERIEDIINNEDNNPTELALRASKIIVRCCQMNVDSHEC